LRADAAGNHSSPQRFWQVIRHGIIARASGARGSSASRSSHYRAISSEHSRYVEHKHADSSDRDQKTRDDRPGETSTSSFGYETGGAPVKPRACHDEERLDANGRLRDLPKAEPEF